MSNQQDNIPVFGSITRLYTNFGVKEHKSDYVIAKCKEKIKGVLEMHKTLLTDEAFVDGILSGGDSANLGIRSDALSSYKVDVSKLDKKYVGEAKTIFQSPCDYVSTVSLVEDADGSLGIDVYMNLSLARSVFKGMFNKTMPFEMLTNRMKSLYNVLLFSKFKLFKGLKSTLKITPGIEIEDLCDILTIEYTHDTDKKKIEKIVRPISSINNASVLIWETSVPIHMRL